MRIWGGPAPVPGRLTVRRHRPGLAIDDPNQISAHDDIHWDGVEAIRRVGRELDSHDEESTTNHLRAEVAYCNCLPFISSAWPLHVARSWKTADSAWSRQSSVVSFVKRP